MDESVIYLGGHDENVTFPQESDFKYLHIIAAKPVPKKELSDLVSYAENFKRVSITVKHCIHDTYDLSFLERFPFLDSFALTAHLFTDFDQLDSIPPGIKQLRIGATNSLKLSLSFIQRFRQLKKLSLEKHKKDIDVISDLIGLEDLEVKSITMPNLAFIGNATSLRCLRIALGGTRNLDLLPGYQRLEKLDLWAINKISDIDAIADTKFLGKIYLDQLSNVEDVKSLHNLKRLEFLSLCRMKRLKSLQWVADAPNLREFSITQTSHLKPDMFTSLAKNKSLRAASIYIGRKHTFTVRDMLGLPEINYG